MISARNKLDSLFLIQLFTPERKQIAACGGEEICEDNYSRLSRQVAQKWGLKWIKNNI